MIVAGRRGRPGGDEIQPAIRLGSPPSRRQRGRGQRLADGDVPSPEDTDRQVSLPEADVARDSQKSRSAEGDRSIALPTIPVRAETASGSGGQAPRSRLGTAVTPLQSPGTMA